MGMYLIILMVVLLCVSMGFLFIGLFGLIKNRPIVFNSKILSILVCLSFLPAFYNSIMTVTGSGAGIIVVAIAFLPLGIVWFVFRGYTIFGVTDELLQDVLFRSLDKLGIEYEANLNSVALKEKGTIQISIQSWVGTAILKPKNKLASLELERLLPSLKQEWANSDKPMNKIGSWIYTVLGGGLLLFLLFLLMTVFQLLM